MPGTRHCVERPGLPSLSSAMISLRRGLARKEPTHFALPFLTCFGSLDRRGELRRDDERATRNGRLGDALPLLPPAPQPRDHREHVLRIVRVQVSEHVLRRLVTRGAIRGRQVPRWGIRGF